MASGTTLRSDRGHDTNRREIRLYKNSELVDTFQCKCMLMIAFVFYNY